MTIWHCLTARYRLPSHNEDWSVSQAPSVGGTQLQNKWTLSCTVLLGWPLNCSRQRPSVGQSVRARGQTAGGCFSTTLVTAIVAGVRTGHVDHTQECGSSGLCSQIDQRLRDRFKPRRLQCHDRLQIGVDSHQVASRPDGRRPFGMRQHPHIRQTKRFGRPYAG